ncbi:hypothetical protein J1N35_022067, partial [Gossypium stocksii]
RVGGKVETQNAHIPPSMQRVHYHTGGHVVTTRLLMDWSIVTRSVQAADWRDVCKQLLGQVSKTIFGAQIDMN